MVSFNSPGVYVIEKDISEYSPTIDSSIVGIVGFASKGETNKATLITSPQQLVRTFGNPSEGIPGQGLEGAIEILEATNKIYFVRADTGSSAEASASVGLGGCPAMAVSAGGFGVTDNLYLKVQVTDNNAVSSYSTFKNFPIPSGTADSQALAMKQVLGGSLQADNQGSFNISGQDTSGFIVGRYAGSGASLEVRAYSDSAYTTGVSALYSLDHAGEITGAAASSLKVWGSTLSTDDTSGVEYLVTSRFPGAGYNAGITPAGATSGNSVEIDNNGGNINILTVNDGGAALETFTVSLEDNKGFIEDEINTGATDITSEVIKGELRASGTALDSTKLTAFTDKLLILGLTSTVAGSTKVANTGVADSGTDFNPRFVKFLEGTTNLSGGLNGTGSDAENKDAIIGDATVTPKTGIQALDDDLLNISIACIPGRNSQEEQNALITLAEQTQNFIALVSPPFAIGSVQNAIDWTNGQSDTRTAAINNSYGAVYWPWVQTFSTADGKNRWFDPVIYGARQMAFTDSVSETWFAPAGYVRGRLTKSTDVEVPLNQGDRDSLYSGGNIINPIVNFPQQGITIWGQRTSQRAPSALDRINVRRLMIFLRKLILASTQRIVFEPNDEFTWNLVQEILNPALADIQNRRGITQFKVVCDETTNTPVRVDRNELWTKILIKPTKTAEAIVFEINLTSQSANFGGSQ